MINYEITTNVKNIYGLDKTKRNILIIGKGKTNNELKTILNPMTPEMAKKIYGESELYNAYKIASDITKDVNIYTVNCLLYTDTIEIIDDLIHYNFDFIVPLDIYLRDTFINPITNQITYFIAYYLERLGITNNKTIIVATERKSDLYNDIDTYLLDMKKVYNDFYKSNLDVINKFGNNLVFVLNNFKDHAFSNITLAASLSVCDFNRYPEDISFPTYFDIDYLDLRKYTSICFYKYHPITKMSSIEQLHNMRAKEDVYKKILIDIIVKYVTSQLELDEFIGLFYSPYTKVQIDVKIRNVMESMLGVVFETYAINKVYFKKTDIGSGRLIIDLSIVPYKLLERINVILEV